MILLLLVSGSIIEYIIEYWYRWCHGVSTFKMLLCLLTSTLYFLVDIQVRVCVMWASRISFTKTLRVSSCTVHTFNVCRYDRISILLAYSQRVTIIIIKRTLFKISYYVYVWTIRALWKKTSRDWKIILWNTPPLICHLRSVNKLWNVLVELHYIYSYSQFLHI